ncbi:helix-turn-helix domain-containing protein [Methylocapsa polymorpha]|uniref:helix-turn-helix domain-containing protein n=1 Tax=Methylocapsa polymorpha TaxID=3080828 RepID=UPI00388E8EEB
MPYMTVRVCSQLCAYGSICGGRMSDSNIVSLRDRISLRIDEVVSASGLSRSSIYKLLKSNELPSRIVAGRRLILKDDLENLIAGTPPSYTGGSLKVDRHANPRD